MAKKLPSRPNLDHLRRQAKSLLAALATGAPEAITVIRDHVPAAKGLTAKPWVNAQSWGWCRAVSRVSNNSPATGGRRWAGSRALVACWIFDARPDVMAEATAGAEVSDSILNEATLTYSIYIDGQLDTLMPFSKPSHEPPTKSKPLVVAKVE